MEEKYDELHALLSAGSYPREYDKSRRQNLRRYASKFTLRDGELFFGLRRKVVKSEEETRRLFAEFHSPPMGGHTGKHKTRSALCASFYWYGMSVDIDKWIQECDQCQKVGKPLTAVQPMQCIKMPFSSKEKVACHRARVNADPAARANYLAKRRESYQRRKGEGKTKNTPVAEFTKKKQKEMREQWREYQRNYREKKKMLADVLSFTPPPADEEIQHLDNPEPMPHHLVDHDLHGSPQPSPAPLQLDSIQLVCLEDIKQEPAETVSPAGGDSEHQDWTFEWTVEEASASSPQVSSAPRAPQPTPPQSPPETTPPRAPPANRAGACVTWPRRRRQGLRWRRRQQGAPDIPACADLVACLRRVASGTAGLRREVRTLSDSVLTLRSELRALVDAVSSVAGVLQGCHGPQITERHPEAESSQSAAD